MNWDQIYSLIRNVLLGLGATLVSKGILSEETLVAIVGGVVALLSVGLSMVFHSDKGQSLMPPAGVPSIVQLPAPETSPVIIAPPKTPVIS